MTREKACKRCGVVHPSSDYGHHVHICATCRADRSDRPCSSCEKIKTREEYDDGRMTCRVCLAKTARHRAARKGMAARVAIVRGSSSAAELAVRRILADADAGRLRGDKWRQGKPRPGDVEHGLPVSVDVCQVWHWSRGREVPDYVAEEWMK